MNAWTDASQIKDIAFKAMMVMPALLLQKTSRKSNTNEHIAALDRRIDLWNKGTRIERTLIRSDETRVSRHFTHPIWMDTRKTSIIMCMWLTI